LPDAAWPFVTTTEQKGQETGVRFIRSATFSKSSRNRYFLIKLHMHVDNATVGLSAPGALFIGKGDPNGDSSMTFGPPTCAARSQRREIRDVTIVC